MPEVSLTSKKEGSEVLAKIAKNYEKSIKTPVKGHQTPKYPNAHLTLKFEMAYLLAQGLNSVEITENH